MKKETTIMRKLLLSFGGAALVLSLLFGLGIILISINSVNSINGTLSSQLADSRSSEITRWMNGLGNEVNAFSNLNIMERGDLAEISPYLVNQHSTLNKDFAMIFFAKPDGSYATSMGGGGNISDRDYFQAIVNGSETVVISNPVVSKSMGIPIFVIAQEVRNENQELVGVFAVTVALDTLSEIAKSVRIGKAGYGFILDGDGVIIAHPEERFIMEFNALDSGDVGYSGLAEAVQKNMSEGSASGMMSREDGSRFKIYLHSVKNSPNWSLLISIPYSQYIAPILNTVKVIAALIILQILVLTVIIIVIARSISKPIIHSAEITEQIAEGDLRIIEDQKLSSRNDELGALTRSLYRMSEHLRDIVAEIQSSSRNIMSGSEEISSTSQTLSEGSSEQAATSEEVASSMEQMNATVEATADNSNQTEQIALQVASDVQRGGVAVENAVKAMNDISERISIIDEIARQTNLLALNAAIEAARAGESGKGFAVVASEVRKLAERSRAAAAEIVSQADSSRKVTNEAASVFSQAIPEIQKTADLMSEVSAATTEQKSGSQQVNTALIQLDQVIQQNASSSENLASMAEEFSSQAKSLFDTVSFFQIDDGEGE